MPHVKVTVTLKPSLLDAQGRVVENALHSLGYTEVGNVRIGKSIDLTIEEDGIDVESRIKDMCDKLLSNPVIENYSFEVIA